MHNFSRTDRSKIAIALVGKNKLIGIHPCNACSHSRCTSVGCFLPVNINIIIGKNGTSNRRNTDGFVLNIQIFNQFSK